MGDILRTVLVIGLVVFAVYGFGKLFTQTPGAPGTQVDYASTVKAARPAADFPLLAPASLPTGWKATSARFDPTSWHLGVLTSRQEYIGLEQLKVSQASAITMFAKGSKAAGTRQIGGQGWELRTGPKNDLTYLRRDGDLTTLVSGDASRAVMEKYVGSLTSR